MMRVKRVFSKHNKTDEIMKVGGLLVFMYK